MSGSRRQAPRTSHFCNGSSWDFVCSSISQPSRALVTPIVTVCLRECRARRKRQPAELLRGRHKPDAKGSPDKKGAFFGTSLSIPPKTQYADRSYARPNYRLSLWWSQMQTSEHAVIAAVHCSFERHVCRGKWTCPSRSPSLLLASRLVAA